MDRFWEKVQMSGADECWEWEACKHPDGYGKFSRDGKKEYAHRAAYKREVGEIPDGLCVLHACDNPACVNPAHLHLGTQADNVQEMDERGRRACHKGEDNPNSKLTEDDVIAIRELYGTGDFTQRELGELFRVSRWTIGNIIRRDQWGHL